MGICIGEGGREGGRMRGEDRRGKEEREKEVEGKRGKRGEETGGIGDDT